MLSPLAHIAAAARKKRMQLKLSQRVVARRVGCSQAYIAQVETARRPISRSLAERLESLFGARRGSYTSATFLRGRPPLSPQSREAMRLIRSARGGAVREFPPVGKPSHPRPDRVTKLQDALSEMESRLGQAAGREVEELESLRSRDERFWRNLNSVHFDSWSEKRLLTRVGLSGVQLVGASPAQLGCELQCVDGKSGRDRSSRPRPAFLLRQDDFAVAWIPQACVRTRSGYRWPDNILVVSRAGRRVTAIVEVQGAEFHSDPLKEKRRIAELGVRVLAVDAGQVGTDGLLQRILNWAQSLITDAGEPTPAPGKPQNTG